MSMSNQIIDRLSGVSGHLPEPDNSFKENQSLDRIEKIKADLELGVFGS